MDYRRGSGQPSGFAFIKIAGNSVGLKAEMNRLKSLFFSFKAIPKAGSNG
jgi:hypothetical protein